MDICSNYFALYISLSGSLLFPLFIAAPVALTGKYIKLMYDEDFRLVGAKTEHFLLEKSRLVHLDNGERSYHILYQVRTEAKDTGKE